MSKVFIPAGYHSCLSLYDIQKAISLIKRVFEDTLCGNLNLSRVSAPLFVEASTGLNDDLNGSAWRCTATASVPARAFIPI